MIFGEEVHGLLVAAVGDIPTGTLGEEPDGSLECKMSLSRINSNGCHVP